MPGYLYFYRVENYANVRPVSFEDLREMIIPFSFLFFLFRIEEIHDEPEEDDDNSKEETDDTVKPAR